MYLSLLLLLMSRVDVLEEAEVVVVEEELIEKSSDVICFRKSKQK